MVSNVSWLSQVSLNSERTGRQAIRIVIAALRVRETCLLVTDMYTSFMYFAMKVFMVAKMTTEILEGS